MKPRNLLSVLIAIVAIVVVVLFSNHGAPTGVATTPIASPPAASRSSSLVVHDVEVYSESGKLVYHGDVDLQPDLARIEAGKKDPYRDDGITFQNREQRLPEESRGYYHEYVVRTPGLGSVGPQRLVLGADGEVYYTSDHYRTFVRVR